MYANVRKLNQPPKIERTHKPAIAYSIQWVHLFINEHMDHKLYTVSKHQHIWTYRDELLEIPSRCNLTKGIKPTVDLYPKPRRKLKNRLFRDMNFRNLRWRPDTEPTINNRGVNHIKLTHVQSQINLLVNEHGGIRPEKQNCKNNNHHMAKQSEEVILHQLKQNPGSCSTTENTTRHLLVLPHEYISSCTSKETTG